MHKYKKIICILIVISISSIQGTQVPSRDMVIAEIQEIDSSSKLAPVLIKNQNKEKEPLTSNQKLGMGVVIGVIVVGILVVIVLDGISHMYDGMNINLAGTEGNLSR